MQNNDYIYTQIMADINETITNITMEYLKPKFPVYKLEVVESYIQDLENHEVEVESEIKVEILEVNDEGRFKWGDECAVYQIDENSSRCSSKFINKMIKFAENRDTAYFNPRKNWVVLSCERIA